MLDWKGQEPYDFPLMCEYMEELVTEKPNKQKPIPRLRQIDGDQSLKAVAGRGGDDIGKGV